ncbi:MAG: hypothetical protein KGI25_06760 [Thaumarchaeota archaeon]|nr:hypothetical protein [Nitrososphaerota archaeon]
MQRLGKIFLLSGALLGVTSALGLLHAILPRFIPYMQNALIVLGILLGIVGTYMWLSTRKADAFWELVEQKKVLKRP